jgi:hypothetical protein
MHRMVPMSGVGALLIILGTTAIMEHEKKRRLVRTRISKLAIIRVHLRQSGRGFE